MVAAVHRMTAGTTQTADEQLAASERVFDFRRGFVKQPATADGFELKLRPRPEELDHARVGRPAVMNLQRMEVER